MLVNQRYFLKLKFHYFISKHHTFTWCYKKFKIIELNIIDSSLRVFKFLKHKVMLTIAIDTIFQYI